MNHEFNWRRFLAFIPVTVALAVLTAYGREIMPQYLLGLIVVFLFTALFLIFYSSPRWTPTLPRERMTKSRILSLFATLAVLIVGIVWLHQRFPQLLPRVVFLLIFASITISIFIRRKRSEK
jgi:uncharacterized membrane protein YfcA